jgi:hypothetical protein
MISWIRSVFMLLIIASIFNFPLYAAGYSGTALRKRGQEQLRLAGIKACAPRILQIIDAVADKGEANFIIEPMSPVADSSTIVITIESVLPVAGSVLSVLNINIKCEGALSQVVYWPKTCDSVKETYFLFYQNTGPIMRSVYTARFKHNLHISFIPSGAGCVTVKKEMFL